MDMNNFDLMLRGTLFSQELVLNMWDDLDVGEKIDLLQTIKNRSIGLFGELATKVVTDTNPVVRMFGIKIGWITKESHPDLYSQLVNDQSPLVRAVIKGQRFFLNKDDFLPLSHKERLVVIALDEHSISVKALATFILEGLDTKTVSEEEAMWLVVEFVRNPSSLRSIQRNPRDGLDDYTMFKEFESIWNLTTCTPWIVHKFIAEEYPLWMGEDHFIGETMPEEMLRRMSTEAHEALAFRQYKPFLEILKKEPKSFPKEVHKSARAGEELRKLRKRYQEDQVSEIESFKKEFREFQTEVTRHLEELSQKLSEALARRHGFFR